MIRAARRHGRRRANGCSNVVYMWFCRILSICSYLLLALSPIQWILWNFMTFICVDFTNKRPVFWLFLFLFFGFFTLSNFNADLNSTDRIDWFEYWKNLRDAECSALIVYYLFYGSGLGSACLEFDICDKMWTDELRRLQDVRPVNQPNELPAAVNELINNEPKPWKVLCVKSLIMSWNVLNGVPKSIEHATVHDQE